MWPLIVFPALWVAGMVVIVRVFRPEPKPCDHQQNWTQTRWVEGGVPMVLTRCRCGWSDRGHVHGSTKGWAGTTTCVDGKIQYA